MNNFANFDAMAAKLRRELEERIAKLDKMIAQTDELIERTDALRKSISAPVEEGVNALQELEVTA